MLARTISTVAILAASISASLFYFYSGDHQGSHTEPALKTRPVQSISEEYLATPTTAAVNHAQPTTQIAKSSGAGPYSTQQLTLAAHINDESIFAVTPEEPTNLRALSVGDSFSWEIGEGYLISGIIDSIKTTDTLIAFGVRLDDDRGRMTFQRNESRSVARLLFNGERTAHRLDLHDSDWQLTETTVSGILCASSNARYPVGPEDAFPKAQSEPVASQLSRARMSASAPAAFQSRPGAPTVIYCDFNGETVNEPDWSENEIVALPSGLSDSEIALVMKIVAEDFAPFDVNVTNMRAVYDSTASNLRVMCVSTRTNTAAPGAGGVAFVDSFVDDLVCWNFNVATAEDAAQTISHEVGHTLNLEHDGNASLEYYEGHSASNGQWAPIMGFASFAAMTQWNNGDYFGANEQQDDLLEITTHGLSYRIDDYGDTSASAYSLSHGLYANSIDGVIERNSDIDVFALTFTEYATIRISTSVEDEITNLDARMRVYDHVGTLLIDYTSDTTNHAQGDFLLQAGTYEVWVSGDSSGSPTSNPPTGWSTYGSLGAYTLHLQPEPLTQADAIDNNASSFDGGDLPWFGQTTQTHDGTSALQSGAIAHNEASTFTITQQTTSIKFWRKVSSEVGYDFLEFRIDNVLQNKWAGEQDWAQVTYTGLSNTTHTFEWKYIKDGSDSSGSDAAWIDQLEFEGESNYATWAALNGGSMSGSTDGNNNGSIDLLEFTLQSDSATPLQAGSVTVLQGTQMLRFFRDTAHLGINARIQVSDDLATWETVALSYRGAAFNTIDGVTVTETTVGGSKSAVTLDLGTLSGTKKFARVTVTHN
ncbi:reprolysin-like metallopeptidase [Coraliomargarita sp. W4R53]